MTSPLKSWQEIGERIMSARRSARLTQEQLARALDIDRSAVSKLETGDRQLDSLELARLADILRRPMGWFVTAPPPSVVSRRTELASDDSSETDLILEFLARDVEQLIELDVLVPSTNRCGSVTLSSIHDAPMAADAARSFAGQHTGPIRDLSIFASRLGLYAFSLNLGQTGAEGASVALEHAGVALINGDLDPGRRRFTLAHEIGHHLLGDPFSNDWSLDSLGSDVERLINAFAAHLLMPTKSVRKLWKDCGGRNDPRPAAIRLAVEYRVSWSAACAHLRNLDLIDRSMWERLSSLPPRRGEMIELGVTLQEELQPPALPTEFCSAVLRAYRKRKINSARALELLRGSLGEAELPLTDEIPLSAVLGELTAG